jgi:homocysteine S-methyltransferase
MCKAAGIDAINIPDGPRASARVNVIYTSQELQRHVGIEAIPHFCGRDRNLIAMQADLLAGSSAGLKNWLLITGDPPKLGDYPDATGVFDLDSIGLCRLCSNLNRGLDAAGKPIGEAAGFLLGVGANPVAIEMEREIQRYYGKIEAGAEYAITQPVFEVDALLRFIERTSKHHTRIPIIAGIYPLVSLRNAQFMNDHVPGVSVPDTILDRLATCTTREDGLKMGIEIARELRQAVDNAVAGIQVSAPLGKIDAALQVLE